MITKLNKFSFKTTGDTVSPNLSDGTFNKDVGCINNNKIKEE